MSIGLAQVGSYTGSTYVNNAIAFNGKRKGVVSTIEYPDRIEKRVVTEPTSKRKWEVGLASFFLCGLGQFMNGEKRKGYSYLVADILSGVFAAVANKQLSVFSFIPSVIVTILSIKDAVRNAYSEVITIEKK